MNLKKRMVGEVKEVLAGSVKILMMSLHFWVINIPYDSKEQTTCLITYLWQKFSSKRSLKNSPCPTFAFIIIIRDKEHTHTHKNSEWQNNYWQYTKDGAIYVILLWFYGTCLWFLAHLNREKSVRNYKTFYSNLAELCSS